MDYSDIDIALVPWVKEHGFTLCNEFGGEPRRFFYVSGGWSECFQISIEPPDGEHILLNLWSVETEDDAELHHAWTVRLAELRSALDEALQQIEHWKSRPR